MAEKTFHSITLPGQDTARVPLTAAEFSTSVAYKVKDYCTYQGKLYRCITAHAAGAWNAAHFTATDVDAEFDRKLDIPVSQASAPANPRVGDLWIDNDENSPIYNVDASPTLNSTNAVQSGGTKVALNSLDSRKMEHGVITGDFSTSVDYRVGDLVFYATTANGITTRTLYRCTTDHNSAAWNTAHFTATTLEVELQRVRDNAADTDMIGDLFGAKTTYAVGDYCIYNDDLYRCIQAVDNTGITTPAFDPDDWSEVKLADEVSDLKSVFNDLVLDNYVWTNPENWLNPNGFKAGNINSYNGREEEYAGICHTDYFIPVEPGKTIYFNRMDIGRWMYMRGFVAYNSNKEFMLGGIGSSAGTYTVPANCYYVKINIDGPPIATTLKPMIYIGDSAPTVYSEYFDPHYVIETNFVNPETEKSLEKLASGQLTTLDIKHKYHCSFPRNRLRMTVGIPETFYYFSAVTPYKTTYGLLGAGVQFSTFGNDCTIFENASVYHGNNGYSWYVYDATFTLIDSFIGPGAGAPRTWLAENLQNCSLLAIGDSTVDQDYMTQDLLDHFTAQGATITLLGTLGSGLNRNEGRAGWKATDYLTDRQYDGVTNPFYNPTTQTFDFSYYMTNQEYTAPDFVVLQLGLNDLGTETNAEIWSAIKVMIDSIIAYNAAIKIILNLPSTPNQDQEKISDWLPLSTSRECSYNEYAQAHALSEYGDTKVRCSYCHLILNPATDIRDNVHPTEAGYNKMALEIANQINHWQNGN